VPSRPEKVCFQLLSLHQLVTFSLDVRALTIVRAELAEWLTACLPKITGPRDALDRPESGPNYRALSVRLTRGSDAWRAATPSVAKSMEDSVLDAGYRWGEKAIRARRKSERPAMAS
jgi:hypothetical protein